MTLKTDTVFSLDMCNGYYGPLSFIQGYFGILNKGTNQNQGSTSNKETSRAVSQESTIPVSENNAGQACSFSSGN